MAGVLLPHKSVDLSPVMGGNRVYTIVDDGRFSANLSPVAVGSFKFVGFGEVDFVRIPVNKIVPEYYIIFVHMMILLQQVQTNLNRSSFPQVLHCPLDSLRGPVGG